MGHFFLWLLVEFLSRRMDQLNFPISSLELARGMTSEVVQLYEPATARVVSTGWLRRMKSTGRVIYAGVYSTIRIPGEENPCVKVTFPCRGSANVYLRPVAHADGSFGLDSSGSGFGKSGFYRLVKSGPEHWRVRNFINAARVVPRVCRCRGSAADGSQDFVHWADDIASALQDDALGRTECYRPNVGRTVPCGAGGLTSLSI